MMKLYMKSEHNEKSLYQVKTVWYSSWHTVDLRYAIWESVRILTHGHGTSLSLNIILSMRTSTELYICRNRLCLM